MEDEKFTLCNIYAPNVDSPEFYTSALNMLDTHENPHKIIRGDLNLCFDLEKNKRGTMYNDFKAVEVLSNYMEQNYMIDLWRVCNPEKYMFTWKRNSPNLVLSRLDYFIITTGTSGWVDNTFIKPGISSDHSLIGIELSPSNIVRGRGFWKFNTRLLDNEEFIGKLIYKVQENIDQNANLNPNDKWENIKLTISSFSSKYAANETKNTREKLVELNKNLEQLIDDQCRVCVHKTRKLLIFKFSRHF